MKTQSFYKAELFIYQKMKYVHTTNTNANMKTQKT